MKTQTTFITLLITLLLAFPSFQPTGKAQAVDQGNILVDVYYGWPNLLTTFLKNTYLSGQSVGEKVSGFGPLGGRFEYMVAERAGVGIEVNTASTRIQWSEEYNQTVYTYDISRQVVRAMIRFNYHFIVSDDFDAYAGVGAGYRNSSWKIKTNDPDFEDETISGVNPVAFRLALGGRYFFTDFIGINLELGISGGPLVGGGITLKI